MHLFLIKDTKPTINGKERSDQIQISSTQLECIYLSKCYRTHMVHALIGGLYLLMRSSALKAGSREMLESNPIAPASRIVRRLPWFSSNLGKPYINTGQVLLERPTSRATPRRPLSFAQIINHNKKFKNKRFDLFVHTIATYVIELVDIRLDEFSYTS